MCFPLFFPFVFLMMDSLIRCVEYVSRLAIILVGPCLALWEAHLAHGILLILCPSNVQLFAFSATLPSSHSSVDSIPSPHPPHVDWCWTACTQIYVLTDTLGLCCSMVQRMVNAMPLILPNPGHLLDHRSCSVLWTLWEATPIL